MEYISLLPCYLAFIKFDPNYYKQTPKIPLQIISKLSTAPEVYFNLNN